MTTTNPFSTLTLGQKERNEKHWVGFYFKFVSGTEQWVYAGIACECNTIGA